MKGTTDVIKTELNLMHEDIQKEMYTVVGNYRKAMYANMRKEFYNEMLRQQNEMYTAWKGEMQALMRTKVQG